LLPWLFEQPRTFPTKKTPQLRLSALIADG
jgi:hypothetical protein